MNLQPMKNTPPKKLTRADCVQWARRVHKAFDPEWNTIEKAIESTRPKDKTVPRPDRRKWVWYVPDPPLTSETFICTRKQIQAEWEDQCARAVAAASRPRLTIEDALETLWRAGLKVTVHR